MRLRETHETQKDYCGLLRLMRLRDSSEIMKLREMLGTHETQKDYCGLITLENHRLMRTHETKGEKWKLMRFRETIGDSSDS